ncbi:MAG: hypothetical protein LJE56_09245 [Acidiferrobacterales bacterium]|jgi:hypothetical protein|nr:hypothetical protein [Acidiferrobacterales bacterium]
MILSHRLIITIVSVVVISFLVGQFWRYLFDTRIPGYLSGLVGGLAALPIWELLKKRKV